MIHSYMPWLMNMWHKFLRGMSHSYVPWFIYKCHDSFVCAMTHVCVTWPITRVMTHSCVSWLIYVCHDSFIGAGEVRTHSDMIHLFVPWLVHVSYDSFICAMIHSYVPWLIHLYHYASISAMTHACASSICASRLTHIWMRNTCMFFQGTTHAYMNKAYMNKAYAHHDSWIYEWDTCIIYASRLTHTWMRHIHEITHESHTWMSHVAFAYIYKWVVYVFTCDHDHHLLGLVFFEGVFVGTCEYTHNSFVGVCKCAWVVTHIWWMRHTYESPNERCVASTHLSFMWLMHVPRSSYVRHDSSIYATWLIHTWKSCTPSGFFFESRCVVTMCKDPPPTYKLSHNTHEWAISRMDKLCHTWIMCRDYVKGFPTHL